MSTIVLKAKTRKAKSRLRQWGNRWEVLGDNNNSWQIVSFEDRTDSHESLRWVNKCCDPDFEILELFED